MAELIGDEKQGYMVRVPDIEEGFVAITVPGHLLPSGNSAEFKVEEAKDGTRFFYFKPEQKKAAEHVEYVVREAEKMAASLAQKAQQKQEREQGGAGVLREYLADQGIRDQALAEKIMELLPGVIRAVREGDAKKPGKAAGESAPAQV